MRLHQYLFAILIITFLVAGQALNSKRELIKERARALSQLRCCMKDCLVKFFQGDREKSDKFMEGTLDEIWNFNRDEKRKYMLQKVIVFGAMLCSYLQ